MLTYIMDERGQETKTDYLIRRIRDDILDGRLAADEKLPSKRALAAHLGISVITVERAYEALLEEGYIYSKERSGFFVRSAGSAVSGSAGGRASGAGAAGAGGGSTPAALPSDDRYDTTSLRRIMRRILSGRPELLSARSEPFGIPELRQAIAAYLLRFRGMDVSPDCVIVGSGSEYLYGHIVQLLGRDRSYGIEDPSYEKIRLVYRSMGADCELLPLGPDGIQSEALAACDAGVLHVSPFHSFPTNIAAPASKRIEYLAWAGEHGAFLIEDDFDSEFTWQRRPLETMYAMDRGGRVIYMNSFSKSLAPSLRAAYMILPQRLMGTYSEKLGFYTCPVPVFEQAVLAEFLNSGQFERHLYRLRRSVSSFAYPAP